MNALIVKKSIEEGGEHFDGRGPMQLYSSTYSEAKELQDDLETYLGTARLASVQHFHPSVGKLSPFVSTGGSSNGNIPAKPNCIMHSHQVFQKFQHLIRISFDSMSSFFDPSKFISKSLTA